MKMYPKNRVAFIMAAIITANFYLCMVVYRLATLLHVNLAITLTIAGLYIMPAIGMFYILYRCISFVPKRPSRHPRRNEKPRKWYYTVNIEHVRFIARIGVFPIMLISWGAHILPTSNYFGAKYFTIVILGLYIRFIKSHYKYSYRDENKQLKIFKTFVEAVDSAYNEPINEVEIYSIHRRKPVFVVDVYTDKYVN